MKNPDQLLTVAQLLDRKEIQTWLIKKFLVDTKMRLAATATPELPILTQLLQEKVNRLVDYFSGD